MQRRESLPAKLPEISIRKKNQMVETCRKFEGKVQAIEEKELDNNQMMSKLEHLFANRKKSLSTSKLLYTLEAHTHKNKLQQQSNQQIAKKQSISQISPVKLKIAQGNSQLKQHGGNQKYNKIIKTKLPEMVSDIETPTRLNLRELVEIQIKGEVSAELRKRKKSAVAIKIVREKQLLPFYSAQDQKLIQLPFTKISESPDNRKIKVRLSNGAVKQVGHDTFYYKVGDEEQKKQARQEREDSLQMQMLIKQSKMNVDNALLTSIIEKAGKGLSEARKAGLMDDLIENYKMSVNYFDHNCMRPGWLKSKIKPGNKLTVSKQVISSLESKLACSDLLEFLDIYELSKNQYIPLLVMAENKVREIGQFIHFDIFQLITVFHDRKQIKNKEEDIMFENEDESQKQQTTKQQKQKQKIVQNSTELDPVQHYRLSKQITNLNLEQNLQNKKSHIDLKIYELESHLDKLKKAIYKDVEHVIKLNPRLVGTPYQDYVKDFLSKFTKFLSVALRSTLSCSVYEQMHTLAQFYLNYFKIEFNGMLGVQQPSTSFYRQIRKISKPYVTPFTRTKILHGPILIMLDLKMKKLKRKNLRNVYKFLLDSRAQIRAYPQRLFEESGSKLGHNHSEKKESVNPVATNKQRIHFDNCEQILNANLVNPIQRYIQDYLSLSENINGCVNSSKISLHMYGEMDKFKAKIQELSIGIERQVISKYQEYFSYWELYLLEKPYIDEVISLFKRINGIRLMQDEMKYLEQDLNIIRSFPNTIEDTVVRIDISNIKTLIISTIKLNMNKIGKASEEVLQRLLSIGHTETQKAKKLNEITPYSTIAQYIEFAKALSQRGVEKSIERVALNAVVLSENWNFLEQHNFPIKAKIMEQYMESCIWVRMLRIAANANKAKLIVDPQIFSNGIVEKKHKIYYKYMFLVKEILEIVKLSEVVQWDRYATLTKNIYDDLREIVHIARNIQQEEELIRVSYYEPLSKQTQETEKKQEVKPTTKSEVVAKSEKHQKTEKQATGKQGGAEKTKLKSKSIFRQNFTFFFKEEAYMSRFALFWQYVLKFKSRVEDAGRLTLYEVHGEHLLKAVRQGQEVLYELKITTVNKRLLGLVQKLNKEMEPFVKNGRIIKVICSGSESARTRAISELRNQLQRYALKKKTEITDKFRRLQEEKDKQLESLQKSQAVIKILEEEEHNQAAKQKEETVKSQQIDQDHFELDNIAKINNFLGVEQMHVTLAQLLQVPFPALDFIRFYQMYAAERKKQEILSKIKQISTHIRSIDVKVQIYQISYPIQPLEAVLIPDSFVKYIQFHNQQISNIAAEANVYMRTQSNSYVIQVYEEYSKDLQQCSKKLSIMLSSLHKMKKVEHQIETIYCCFELLLPQLLPASQDLLAQYRPIYDQFRLEYAKKLQVLKKLSYIHLYEDRVRISYDQEMIKFEELKIRMYNHPAFGMRVLSSNNGCIGHLSMEHCFSYLLHLPTSMAEAELNTKDNSKFDEAIKKISKSYYEKQAQIKHFLPSGWTNLTFTISFDDKEKGFMVTPTRLKTANNEMINLQDRPNQPDNKTANKKELGLRQKLFKVEVLAQNRKQQAIQTSTATLYECRCGILESICQLNELFESAVKRQTMQLLHLVYEQHYNIKDIFLIYITLKQCLFQSLMMAMQAIFCMDLLLMWENDYDIMLLRDKIRQCYQIGFASKESENNELIEQIYNLYEFMIGTIDLIARRRFSENDRDLEGADIDIEKIRKKLIIEFLPIMVLEGFDSEDNRKLNRDWLFALKKNKQDDFINETHLNPAFLKIISSLNKQWQFCKSINDKIEFKEIEKKDDIQIRRIQQSLYQDLIQSSEAKKNKKFGSQPIKQQAKLENFISITGQNNFRLHYKFQMTKFVRCHSDKIEHTTNATMMVIQAVRHGKFLVTNYHPNCALLGRKIINCFIKIPKNNQSGKIPRNYSEALMQRVQNTQKEKAEELLKNGTNSNNSADNLRASLMSGISLETPKARRQSQSFGVKGVGKVIDTRIKSIASVNFYELPQSVDHPHIGQLEQTGGIILENYNKQMLDDLLATRSIDCCIHVQDQDSMIWVIDYLTERKKSQQIKTHKSSKEQENREQTVMSKHSTQHIVYIYCYGLEAKILLQHPRAQQCLLYINQSHQSQSNAVLNPNYAQKTFTHSETKKGTLNKTEKKIRQLVSVETLPTESNQSLFVPLPTHIHSNPLLAKFECLHPYCPKPGPKIYSNSLITPPNINQASSPNLSRSPMNPKFRQLALKCIAKYYSWLRAEQFLEIAHLEPIVHSLHYNSFIVESSRRSPQGQIEDCTSYIIDHQIGRIMRPAWALIMKEIFKLQLGESGTNYDIAEAIRAYRTHLYVVPVHAMTVCELLGSMPITFATGKNINGNHYKRVQKGVIEQIVELASVASSLTMGNKASSSLNSSESLHKLDPTLLGLQQFMLPDPNADHQDSLSNSLNASRWFILDLSVANPTSFFIYRWLCSSFMHNCFMFMNQHCIQWDHDAPLRVVCAKKQMFNTSHNSSVNNMHLVKIIILVHPSLLAIQNSGPLSKVEVLPHLDLISNFNPMIQLTIKLPSILATLPGSSASLPDFQQVMCIFKKLMFEPQVPAGSLFYSKWTPRRQQMFLTRLSIMINELRKARLANGLYTEAEVSDKESKNIFVCSIELREKIKSSYHLMLQLQEIEKNLDAQRKQMYRLYTSTFNLIFNPNEQKQLSFNPTYISLDQLSSYLPDNYLTKQIQASLSESMKAFNQKLIPNIGLDKIAKIVVQTLYDTLVADGENPYTVSEWLISPFSNQATSPVVQASKKKPTKSNRKSKQINANLNLSLNHPNLLYFPTVSPSAANPYPISFSLVEYTYNVALDAWLLTHEHSLASVQPNKTNCSPSRSRLSLHPSEILRLNPSLNANSKQSVLKLYCQATGTRYEPQIIRSKIGKQDRWRQYLLVYGEVFTLVNYKRKQDEAQKDDNFRQLLWSMGQSDLHFEVDDTQDQCCSEEVEAYLRSKYSPLCGYGLFRPSVHRLNRCLFSSIVNNEVSDVRWEHASQVDESYSDQVVLIDAVLSRGQVLTEEFKRLITIRFGHGITVHQCPPLEPAKSKLEHNMISEAIELYMKHKSIANVSQLLITPNSAGASKKKSKEKNEHKHHAEEGLSEESISMFLNLKQVHLDRLIAFAHCYAHPEIYPFMLEVVLHLRGDQWNRYTCQLDAYGIAIMHKPARLTEIYGEIVEMNRREKLMRNQLAMGNNELVPGGPADIEEYKAKMQESIGKQVFHYISEACPQLKVGNSEFTSYTCRYLLPKPKKFKFTNIPFVSSSSEPLLRLNGTFAELIPLSGLRSQVKSNAEEKVDLELNENYLSHIYDKNHNFAALFELQQHVIVSLVSDIHTAIGQVSVGQYITGFLLYTKARLFVHSQIITDQRSTDEQPRGNKFTLNSDSINQGVFAFTKQFSLIDAKVAKIIHQFWRLMHRPKIRVDYTCLHCETDQAFEEELQWVLLVDIDNERKFIFQKQEEKLMVSPQRLNKKKWPRAKTFGNRSSINNSQISSQSIVTANEDELMGVLRFVEVVNLHLTIGKVRKYYQKQRERKGNCNQYVIILAHTKLEKKNESVDIEARLKQELEGSLWIKHRRQTEPKYQDAGSLPTYLKTTTEQKERALLEILTNFQQEQMNKVYIPASMIGKQYLPAILRKKQQLKDIVLDKKQEQAAKKQVYDNCALDIQTLHNKIQEAEDAIKDTSAKVAAWSKQLSSLSGRLDFYVGQNEFLEAKNKILTIPRKNIEKEVLKAAYIEDNPLNLSFIYRFNVLADSAYFPDKNFEVYEHEYQIGSKYSVFEEQKKQFVKLINMGRLNVMLENEDYWPNEDQILSTEKLRKQFIYLTPIDKIAPEKQFSKEDPYSLSLLVRNEIDFIRQHAHTQAQRCFHMYICLLSAHSFIRHQLTSNRERLTKSIKTGEEECKVLSNKIRDNKANLKQQEDKLVVHKSRLQRSGEEVKNCQNNQEVFGRIAEENIKKLQKLLEQNLFGIETEQREAVMKEICRFIVYEFSAKCQECSKAAGNEAYHPLSVAARRYLFYLVSIPTIKNSVLTYKINAVSSLYGAIYLYLLEHCLMLTSNMKVIECRHMEQASYLSKVDYRKYNVVVHSEDNIEHVPPSDQLYLILAKAVYPQLADEPKLLLQKLERMAAALEVNLQKFVEKVDLVQAKDIQSIRRFQITEEITSTIMQGYRNACIQFEGLDYLGDWARKNKTGVFVCKSIVEHLLNPHKVCQNLKKLNITETQIAKHCSQISLAYYCRLIGEIIQRGNHIQNLISNPVKVVPFTDTLLRQLVYEHLELEFRPIANQLDLRHIVSPLDQKLIHKQTIDSLVESTNLINSCTLLDNLIELRQQVIFIEANEMLQALLASKLGRGNFKIIAKEVGFNRGQSSKALGKQSQPQESSMEDNEQEIQPSRNQDTKEDNAVVSFFEYLDDTTTQHWIVFRLHIYQFVSLDSIGKSILQLRQKIAESRQQNTKYMFIVDGEIKAYAQLNIQPVYSIYAGYHIAAVLKSQLLNGQFNQRQLDCSVKGMCEQLIGKMFDYYSSLHVHESYLRLFTSYIEIDGDSFSKAPYSRPESIAALHKFTQLNSITVNSSLEYRILKKLMASLRCGDEDRETYEIVQGYLIFKAYHGASVEKYPLSAVKEIVESVVRGDHNGEEIETEEQQVKQINKIKNRFLKFIQFLQDLHSELFIDRFAITENKKLQKQNHDRLAPPILIEQSLLAEFHLVENKMRYSIKNKDATQEIVHNLFNKTNSKSKSASKHSFSHNKLAVDTDLLLADPKIYVILNKTFKRAINKVATLKFNKNNLMAKQTRHRKRAFTSFKQVDQLWQHLWFTDLWQQTVGLHKAQFLMWAYSEVENIKMNNIYFAVKPKALNLLDIPSCDQLVEGEVPKQYFQAVLEFNLYCVKAQQLLISGICQEGCFKIQLQATLKQIDQKTMKFYRGLLFRYEEHFENQMPELPKLEQSVTFKDMSAVKEDQFLKPHGTTAENEESVQASSPTISKDAGQPTSPMFERKLTRRLSLNKTANMKQSSQLNKMNYLVVPVYCCSRHIGVLEVDIKLCKGFDPVRTFAVLK